MAKKKRKKKSKTTRKKVKRIKRIKRRIKKLSKKRRRKSKKKFSRNKKTKSSESKELVFKVPKKWSNSAYINKGQYEKNINYQLKIMKVFGKKKENELIGSNLIQK